MFTAQKKWEMPITNLLIIYRAFVNCVGLPDVSNMLKDAGTLNIVALYNPSTTITLVAAVDLKTIILTSTTDNINTNNNFTNMCNLFEQGLKQ